MKLIRLIASRDWIHAAAAILALVAAFLALLLIYQIQFQGTPPMVVNRFEIVDDRLAYAPGDVILVEMDYCRKVTSEATYTTSWVDTVMYVQPDTYVSGGEIGCKVIRVQYTVPPIPPGQYNVVVTGAFRVNWQATRVVTWGTEEFTIMEK